MDSLPNMGSLGTGGSLDGDDEGAIDRPVGCATLFSRMLDTVGGGGAAAGATVSAGGAGTAAGAAVSAGGAGAAAGAAVSAAGAAVSAGGAGAAAGTAVSAAGAAVSAGGAGAAAGAAVSAALIEGPIEDPAGFTEPRAVDGRWARGECNGESEGCAMCDRAVLGLLKGRLLEGR